MITWQRTADSNRNNPNILTIMEKREMLSAAMNLVKYGWAWALLLIFVMGTHVIAAETSKAGDLQQKNESTAAISAYQSMLERDPNSVDAHLGLIRSFYKKDDVTEANEAAEKALKLFPDNASLHALWGDVLFRMAKTKEARDAYLKAIQLDPKNGRGYLGLAKLHSFNFNRKSARSMEIRAYECNPEDPEIIIAYASNLSLEEQIHFRSALNKMTDKPKGVTDNLKFYTKWDDQKIWKIVNPPEKAEIKLTPIRPSGRDAVNGYAISALIKGKKVDLLLDTGARDILINRKLADKLGLQMVGSAMIKGIGDSGAQTGSFSLVPTVQIGPIEFRDCTIKIMERQPAGGNADGIIGIEQFNRYLVTLNLPENMMKLNPLPPINGKPFDDPESWKGIDRTIPPELESFTRIGKQQHLLVVPVIVNRKKSGFFLLDSGASIHVVDRSFAEQVTNLRSSLSSIRGVSGKAKTFVAQNISLRLGKFQQENDGMYAIDLKDLSHNIGVEIAGMLGHPLLRQFAITIDYRDGLIDFDYAYAK
jgi:tetratricopeptide (TPR) repeat protein